MVFIMVLVASLFFFVADYIMSSLVRLLLGLGS
jgi:preprotein translocase subunit SecE